MVCLSGGKDSYRMLYQSTLISTHSAIDNICLSGGFFRSTDKAQKNLASAFGKVWQAPWLHCIVFAHPCAPPCQGRLWDLQQGLLEKITT
ncbi:MAG: hypothetical protein ACJAUL_003067, partial [Paraglaciecola sp.]